VTEWRTLSGDQFREFWRGWKSEVSPPAGMWTATCCPRTAMSKTS
jgi:hypothetical protein